MRPAESLWQDARVAVRVLRKNSGTSVLCVLSIAMGIGLTMALFSVADAVFLRPYPLEKPAEVLTALSVGDDGRIFMYGWPDFEDMAHAGSAVTDIAAYTRRGAMLKTGEESSFIFAYASSPNFFTFLGVHPALGRASLEPISGRPAAVLGYRLWQRRFAGDPQIVGKTVLLNGEAFTVAGIMPREFTGLARLVANDVWVSANAWFDVLGGRGERSDRDGQFQIVARLKPGANATAVAAQLDAVIRGPGKHKPAPKGAAGTFLDASFVPGWGATLIGGGGLLMMLGLVLFSACANVALLRLAQAETRKKEIGIRIALGADAWRVIRQLLVETALVTVAGAALGILLAQSLMEKTAEFMSSRFTFIDAGMRLDHRVLIFALVAATVAVLLAGLPPARHAGRLNVTEILKSEEGTTGALRLWRQKALIVGQVAVSVVLFGMAVVFIQSLKNAAIVRPGLDPDKKLLVMEVEQGSDTPRARWCQEACERLSGLPGVRAATFARRLPLSGSGGGMTVRVETPGQAPHGVHLNNVAGNYFAVMGTRVLAGRGIDRGDRESSAPIVVVSQLFARQVFSGRNPLGECISVDGKKRQVVGVAEDGPSNDLHESPRPFLYLPFTQMPSGDVTLMVETAGEPAALAQAARHELTRLDPGVSVLASTTLHEHMQRALTTDQLLAAITSGLGVFGFLLTAAGLFGVVQCAVNRRTREIGLRISLGAEPSTIGKMVLGESMRMAAWGIPIGLVLLGAAAWWARSLVFGVALLDPFTYTVSAAAAVSVALLAAWLPARRAVHIEPMAALRSE